MSVPDNYDDAFGAGWAFGRRHSDEAMPVVRAMQKAPVLLRRAFERGVSEGYEFQVEWDEAEARS